MLAVEVGTVTVGPMRGTGDSTGRVTIKEVAAAAGVSPTTVSHTLSGKRRVDPETRARVVETADRLGYRANRTARALRAGGTSTIAFMLPDQAAGTVDGEIELREMLDLEYYMRIASAAATTAFGEGHALLLTPRVEDRAQLDALGFDGAIVCDPVRNDRRLRQLDAAGIPAVTIERELGQPEHRWYVAGDNRQNMRRLLDHLEAVGARRIALLSTVGDWAWAAESEEAFTDWSAERGLTPVIEPTSLRDLERSAYERTTELLARDPRPDAIVALGADYPSGVLRAARDRGLQVPRDLLVAAGIDGGNVRHSHPPVTAIDLQPGLQGEAAARLLIARLRGEDIPRPCTTPSLLHVRASTTPGG